MKSQIAAVPPLLVNIFVLHRAIKKRTTLDMKKLLPSYSQQVGATEIFPQSPIKSFIRKLGSISRSVRKF